MQKAVRYRVLKKIANGGMAEIFLAVQIGAEGFQKPVVLKRILPAFAANGTFVRMLVDEAHIASTLNHSNLVQVLDLGKAGDQFFLVLEFVDGWSLEQVRQRALRSKLKMPVSLALYVVGALCRGLAYAHTRTRNGKALGIVHRDVSPQNVLVSREGEVKLADFGIAKAAGRSEKSATGVIKGKFAYMSPEQSMGAELDARSDLFSVGTLLYILTTGKKPFEAATDMDVLMRVRKAKYEKPSLVARGYNPEVERFIARALRSDLSRRWQTAEQMADKLETIQAKLGQASGPAALKRWLSDLADRDGLKPPAEIEEVAPDPGTIELGSRDLELKDVSSQDDSEAGADSQADAPTSAQPPRSRKRADTGRPRPVSGPGDEILTVPESARATRRVEVAGLPTFGARLGRLVRRVAITTLLLVTALGGGVYFARPHLPGWLVARMDSWVRSLPPPIGAGEALLPANEDPSR